MMQRTVNLQDVEPLFGIEARRRPRVVVAVTYINDYRVPFFNALRQLLNRSGVDLVLITGTPPERERKSHLPVSLGWETPVTCTRLFKDRVVWMPFRKYAETADLVIIVQENKLIYNLWLQFIDRPVRLAYWGHGRNMQQSKRHFLAELFKRWVLGKVDWWFAYTDLSASIIADARFPTERITVVDNAVDTSELAAMCNLTHRIDCERLRKRMGMQNGPIGLYLGSLQRIKRLGFLIDAALRIRALVPNFQLLVAGDGPDRELVREAAARHDWIFYAGPLRGHDKAAALMLADVLLNPGAVGLGVLDSFTSGTPLFTTACGTHGPEIAYVRHDVNAVITADSADEFALAVASTLGNANRLAALRSGALASGAIHNVDSMAARFHRGVMTCLASEPKQAT
jgi:glycosyltransferase involved in cell wall biosynthesis